MLGAKACTPEINTSEIVVEFSGSFQLIVSGIVQRNFTAQWNCPKDCHLSSGCSLEVSNELTVEFSNGIPLL